MASGVKNRNSELIGKRWAKALMELAQEDNGISKDDILENLKYVEENIESSMELGEILANPSVSTAEKQVVLTRLFQTSLMPIVFNFIISLNEKGRLGVLSSIIVEFQKQLEDFKNIIRVEITSAIELSNDKKEYIKNRVAEKLKKVVLPEWRVNADIIGGLVFNINETIVDNSIQHRLNNFSKNIVKG